MVVTFPVMKRLYEHGRLPCLGGGPDCVLCAEEWARIEAWDGSPDSHECEAPTLSRTYTPMSLQVLTDATLLNCVGRARLRSVTDLPIVLASQRRLREFSELYGTRGLSLHPSLNAVQLPFQSMASLAPPQTPINQLTTALLRAATSLRKFWGLYAHDDCLTGS